MVATGLQGYFLYSLNAIERKGKCRFSLVYIHITILPVSFVESGICQYVYSLLLLRLFHDLPVNLYDTHQCFLPSNNLMVKPYAVKVWFRYPPLFSISNNYTTKDVSSSNGTVEQKLVHSNSNRLPIIIFSIILMVSILQLYY